MKISTRTVQTEVSGKFGKKKVFKLKRKEKTKKEKTFFLVIFLKFKTLCVIVVGSLSSEGFYDV